MTYTKQEWIDQQTVISAARMDHIEGGVEDAHNLTGDLDTRLTAAEGQASNLDVRLTATEDSLAALPQVQAGRVVVTPTASTPTSADVTFPVAFRAVPEMTASALSAVPGTVNEVTVDAITTTGARIWMHRTSGVTTSVSWIAVAV